MLLIARFPVSTCSRPRAGAVLGRDLTGIPDMSSKARQPRMLLLSEGDAESWDSWSGTSRSVLTGLRQLGHDVISGDVDIYGVRRPLIGLTQFSPNRQRWWVKYHLGRIPFEVRSHNASRILQKLTGRYDGILQFGATFLPNLPRSIPSFLYCDGNIALSSHARPSGQSEACYLTDREIYGVKERETRIYRAASHIFTISERLRESFIDDFGIESNKVTTVYAGANLPDVHFHANSHDSFPGPPTILFVGRNFERKGGDVLLSAFRRVREEVPEARLLLLGPEGLRIGEKNVTCLGLIDKDSEGGAEKIANIYRSAHVFCMPTRYEGLSISFLEAMNFGLPCVSTYNDWARPEMIVPGDTGLVVPRDDDAGLAQALVELLSDPDRARGMGERGKVRARSVFTWKRVTELMSTEITNHFRSEAQH